MKKYILGIIALLIVALTLNGAFALDDDMDVLMTQVPKADGIYVVNFSLYDASVNGTRQFNHDLITGVNVSNNIAPIVVENLTGVDFSVPLWMHIIINGTTLDRDKLLNVPSSFDSNDTQLLGGKVEADLNVNSSLYLGAYLSGQYQLQLLNCTAGNSIRSVLQNGTVTCEADSDTTYNSDELWIYESSDDFYFNNTYSNLYTRANTTKYWDGLDSPSDLENKTLVSCKNITGGTDTDFCADAGTKWVMQYVYLYNDSTDIIFNETQLNATIEALSDIDTDTTYDSDETFIYESSDVFYLNSTYAVSYLNVNNSATTTALVANGGNCAAGSYPLGVDDSGAVESCTDATTEIDSTISTHTGDDDAHQALVTITGQDYLTLSTQQITMGEIEPDDLAGSDFGDFTCDGNTCSLDDSFQPLESTLTDIADGTIAENLVNTDNPWVDNEVSDTLTCSILTDDDTYALTASAETFDEPIDFSKNVTIALDYPLCFGNCSHIYMVANSTTLAIKVN